MPGASRPVERKVRGRAPRPLFRPASGELAWPQAPDTRHRVSPAPGTPGTAVPAAEAERGPLRPARRALGAVREGRHLPAATAPPRRHCACACLPPVAFPPGALSLRAAAAAPSLPVFRFSLSGRCEGKDGVAQGRLRGCRQRLRRLERQRQGRRHGRLRRQASADRRAGERRGRGRRWRRGGPGRAAAAAWSRRRGWCRPWGRAAAGGTVFVPGPGSSWRPEEQERFHPPPELPNPRPGSPVVVPGEESDSLPCVSEGRDRVGVNCF